ncbi:MAG: hypothetical protein AAGH67_18510 [Cyanobacteria bacterium P01_H01_bin.162]
MRRNDLRVPTNDSRVPRNHSRLPPNTSRVPRNAFRLPHTHPHTQPLCHPCTLPNPSPITETEARETPLCPPDEAYFKAQQRIANAKRIGSPKLDLSRFNLTQVPKELGQLANLTELYLDQNQLTQVPKELGHLTKLAVLYLDQNQLTQVPKELGQLANLTRLSLGHNQLKQVPKELSQLANLTRLSLGHNQLKQLPKELGQLTKLAVLYLDQNPDLASPPPEVIAQGRAAVLTYLREQKTDGERQWLSKLLVVGEGGVGKTSLLRALRGESFGGATVLHPRHRD